MPTKKNIKVRDLKPKKDAKGGGAGINHSSVNHSSTNSSSTNSSSLNKHTVNHGHGVR